MRKILYKDHLLQNVAVILEVTKKCKISIFPRYSETKKAMKDYITSSFASTKNTAMM